MLPLRSAAEVGSIGLLALSQSIQALQLGEPQTLLRAKVDRYVQKPQHVTL